MTLDGKVLAERLRAEHAPRIEALRRDGRRPRLLALHVGDDPATAAYMRGQRKGADAWGIAYETRGLPANASEADVREALRAANDDSTVTGVLLQLPLPAPLPSRALQHAIEPSKDVEGVHPENLGNVVYARPGIAPCTAAAVMALVEASGRELSGAEAVVVGHSEIVGKPVALLLLARDATTTVCHKFTRDLAAHVRRADVLVVAVGRPHLVTPDLVKSGAVVVDVGINAVPAPGEPGRTRIVGDVDPTGLAERGCLVTPVPGGVGPVTVAMLLRNTLLAAERTPPPPEPALGPLFRHLE